MREETRKAKTKEKKEFKSSSPSAVRFAQESKLRRRGEKSTSPSPLRNAKHPVSKGPEPSWKTKVPVRGRSSSSSSPSSSSSSSSGGAAIDDWAD